MSIYVVSSPLTNGEILGSVCELINHAYGYFTNLAHRDLRGEMQGYTPDLKFRFEKGKYDDPLNVMEAATEMLERVEAVFGVPWSGETERLRLLCLYWSFRDLVGAQTEAPQYPYRKEVWGRPLLLSEEISLVKSLFAGSMDEAALLRRINSDIGHESDFLPKGMENMIFYACRYFQKAIILTHQGAASDGLELALRAFFTFLPTMHLGWRNIIVEFICGHEQLAEILRQRSEDFSVKILLEERRRQEAVKKAAVTFNEKTNRALADMVSFEWLNAPNVRLRETQISFGIMRPDDPWWKPYHEVQ